ncbi:MAG: phytoene desaturase family protein [Bacteroidota bacterium]
MTSKKQYDVIIIGSGLGGLICGIILQKHGYSTCILEQHSQIGGNIQTFTRKGCTFTTGMHYIGSLNDGQILHQLFNYLGILDKIKIKKLDEDCFEKIIIEDDEYCYAMGIENFKKRLIDYFPEEIPAIEKYVQKLEEIWNKINIINLREVSEKDIYKADADPKSAYDFIDSLTDNYKLKAVLAATNGLYAGVKDKTPLHIHAIINKFFIQSAWKLDEREVSFADVLLEEFEKQGGTIKTRKKVNKIICNENKAVAVKTTDQDIIYGKSIISNIHPELTNELIEPGILRKAYINRIKGLENSISPFSLYIVLKEKTFKHINSNIYYSSSYDVWGVDTYNSENWPQGYIFYTTPSSVHQGFAESATIITYMKYDEVKKWKNTTIAKRGNDYIKFKEEKTKQLLNLIEKKIPGLKSSIDSLYSSTPLTFRDYTGSPGGSMYGVIKDYKDPLSTFLSHNTRIPNIFLTGQNINLHGMLGVAISAIITCSGFLDINKLINDIKDE